MNMKYAIIGYPVEHSLSPLMHEAGFRALGLDAEYLRIPIQMSDLAEGVRLLQQNGYHGWNVTYPLKEQIISLLDTITPLASAIGAVNTVKVLEGSLQGHNTDGEGFIESLTTKGYDFRNKKAVILGAGGSAKAIAVALAQREVELHILNRTELKAKRLAKHISALGGKASWGILDSGQWLKSVDLLIQTTPVGMRGEEYLFNLKGINSLSWVIDLIYHPIITPFLLEAASYGCRTMNGLEMLLYQGALAWRFWLNMEAPISVMRKALLEETKE
jgi:shikimate dehydrogenase